MKRRKPMPQLGRSPEVYRLFGLKKGTLYNLHAEGKINSVLLKVTGEKGGVRLWDLDSIRAYIQSQMPEEVAG